jgi:hypothetical protein
MNRQNILMCKRIVITVSLMLVLGLNGIWVQAQEPAPTQPPKSPEVLRLEEEKAQAVLRQQIAEARKAELAARFPAGSSTPLAGTTTINDNAIIESYMMAYVSMAKAGNRIVESIKQKNLGIKNLAIYNERDVTLVLAYKVADAQVDALKKQFDDWIIPPTAATPPSILSAAPLTIAESFLGNFVDLTAFLRTNVDIKGTSFEIEEGPLVAEVFRAARGQNGLPGIILYYPYVFPPDIDPTKRSPILGKIENMRLLRILAAKFLSDVAAKDQEIVKAKAKADQTKGTIELLIAKQQDAIARAQRILDTYCPKIAKEAGNQPPNATTPPPGDALDQRAEEVLVKIKKIEAGQCRSIPAERREVLFEMRDILKQARLEKDTARNNLRQTNEDLKRLALERADLANQLTGPKGNDARTALLTLNRQNPNENDLAKIYRYIDNAVVFLKTASEQFDKFVTSIVQADAAVGVNPLTSYIRAEKIKEALGITASTPEQGYWLQLKVIKAGGNNRIKTNLIVDIFTGGNRLSHSGGTIVQYSLYNSLGQQVASDTITEYINYIKSNKIRELPCEDIDAFAKRKDCLDEVKK